MFAFFSWFAPALAWARFAWLVPAGAAALAAAESFTRIDAAVISQQPDFYLGWPTVAGRGDELHLVYSGGRDDHVCPFGRVELMISRDAGRTWSWPRVVYDSPIDDRDAAIMRTSRGTLLVSSYSSLAYQIHLRAPERRMNAVFGAEVEARLARWRLAELGTTEEEKQRLRRMWMTRSVDDGLTWSEPYPMPCYSPHGPTERADGTLFFAGADGKKAGAWVSRDDGLSWALLSELPARAAEIHGLEAADGTLVVQVRDRWPPTAVAPRAATPSPAPPPAVEGPGVRATLQTESHDGGKTWTPLRDLGVRGYPSHLLRLRDGRLLMTYGWRQAPQGVRARLSRDHGRTWGDELVLTADGTTDDLGYPSTVQVADGSLVTIWYEVIPPARPAVLRQLRWRPAEK